MANSYPASGQVILDDLKLCTSARLQPHFVSTGEHMFLSLESAHQNSYLPVVTFLRAGCVLGAIGLERASNSDSLGSYAESEMIIGSRASVPTSIQTGGVRRIRISSDGNIGVGLASPCGALDAYKAGSGATGIGDNLIVRGGNNNNLFGSNQIRFGYSGGIGYSHAIKSRHNSGSNTQNALDFFLWTTSDAVETVGTRNVMTLEGTGNVGIGTCSPTATLQVRGPNATGTFFDAQNDGAAGATFVRANNTFPFNEYTFANGNVGIGTTPTSLSNVRLQICDGNAAGTDDMVRLMQCLPGNHAWYRSQRCGGATMIMGSTRNSGDGCIPSDSAIIWTTGNNPLVIGTCGRERMRFSTAGNAVLGGTSSNVVGFTGTVLTVNGGGNYQGYEVSTSNVTRMTMVSDGSNGYMSTRVAGMCLIFEAGAASEKMRIGSDGRVGIGTSSASYLLHVNGTFYSAGSSVDYKQGICNYNTDSCLFMCLKPVTYQYKDEYTHLGKELKSETQIGLIAEDVADVYPELAILVNEDEQKVVRNVDYEKLSIILLSEVQKLRKEVDNLKNNK